MNQAKNMLFEGVIHRQVGVAGVDHLKAYVDAVPIAIKELIEEWQPKKRIKDGLIVALQLHERTENKNPHLHSVVSGGE